jgi:hypothetical protein
MSFFVYDFLRNLIRSINHEYGAPINRFTIFARLAVQGIHKNEQTRMKILCSSFDNHLIS